ncbi:MAG TPA: DUF2520 domain-containing protein [Actinomycetota bacterium]|nr:DUF2520 domain-containing protein [Actinomycetota bacterium]
MTSPPPPDPPLRVALVGAGRVGTAVAGRLRTAGHEIVGVWSRSDASIARAQSVLDAPSGSIDEVVARANLVLLGTPEAALVKLGGEIAGSISERSVVCHFSGSVGIGPLSSVTSAGLCALHPVASFPDERTGGPRLEGVAWGRTCSAGLEAWADALVRRDLGGVPIAVAEDDRPVWHAAAVTTANGTAALLAAGEALLRSVGVRDPWQVIGPLTAGVLANASELGVTAALTGPIARGDTHVVERHLEALQERTPSLLPLYLAASWSVFLAAEREGRLDPESSRRLRASLSTTWR